MTTPSGPPDNRPPTRPTVPPPPPPTRVAVIGVPWRRELRLRLTWRRLRRIYAELYVRFWWLPPRCYQLAIRECTALRDSAFAGRTAGSQRGRPTRAPRAG